MKKIGHFLLASFALCAPLLLLLGAFRLIDLSSSVLQIDVICIIVALSWLWDGLRSYYMVGLLPWVRIGKEVCGLIGVYCLAIAELTREFGGVLFSAERAFMRRV